MRDVALFPAGLGLLALLAMQPGCKDQDHRGKAEPSREKPAASTTHATPTVRSRRLGRGRPPEVFQRADSNGRVLAQDPDHLYWIEQLADGSFVMARSKTGGEPRRILGPLTTVTSLSAGGGRVAASAAAYGTRGGDRARSGVIATTLAELGSSRHLSGQGGTLAQDGAALYLLRRGDSKEPGAILQLTGKDATASPAVLYRGTGSFGRADLAAASGWVVWLEDRHQIRDGIRQRVGTIRAIPPGAAEARIVARGFLSPGPHLQVHGQQAYFTARDQHGRRSLYRAPLAPGKSAPKEPERLLDPAWEVTRFAVDDTGIYAYASKQRWQIVRIDFDGRDLEVVSTPEVKVASRLLASDDGHLYWGTSGAIRRVLKKPPDEPVKKDLRKP